MDSHVQFIPAGMNISDLYPNEFWETTAAARRALGAKFEDTMGRIWRYTKFAADLSAGHLVQPAAATNITTGYVVSNVAAVVYEGQTYAIKQVLTPATAPSWTQGAYAGMLGMVSDGTGEGQYFRIRDNSATSLYLEEALGMAITVVGEAEILFMSSNKYKDVVKGTTALGIDGPAIGSVQVDVDYSEAPYGWILTRGPGVGIIDTSASQAVGSPLCPSSATAGQLILAATAAAENIVAKSILDADDTITNLECVVDYCIE